MFLIRYDHMGAAAIGRVIIQEIAMSRLTVPTREAAPAGSQPLLDGVHKQLGSVPNLFRLIGLSPAALEGFLGLNGALAHSLDARTRERIAIAVAQANGCDYCLSAHSYIALNLVKLGDDEIALARKGASTDAKAEAALRFSRRVLETRGRVAEADLAAVRSAGYSEAQVVEIVAVIASNIFTNYLGNIAETEIDFPVIRSSQAA